MEGVILVSPLTLHYLLSIIGALSGEVGGGAEAHHTPSPSEPIGPLLWWVKQRTDVDSTKWLEVLVEMKIQELLAHVEVTLPGIPRHAFSQPLGARQPKAGRP
jgi:hypothetical protein